jgi:hypothetical protein
MTKLLSIAGQRETLDSIEIGAAKIARSDLPVGCVVLLTDDMTTIPVYILDAGKVIGLICDAAFDYAMHMLTQRGSEWRYLLIVGDVTQADNGGTTIWSGLDGFDTSFSYAALQGALLSAQELGVGVLTVPSRDDVPAALTRLAKRDRSRKRIAPPREVEMLSDDATLLMALPGVGPETATKLLAYAGNAGAALVAILVDDAAPMPKRAREQARAMLRTLHAALEEELVK